MKKIEELRYSYIDLLFDELNEIGMCSLENNYMKFHQNIQDLQKRLDMLWYLDRRIELEGVKNESKS